LIQINEFRLGSRAVLSARLLNVRFQQQRTRAGFFARVLSECQHPLHSPHSNPGKSIPVDIIGGNRFRFPGAPEIKLAAIPIEPELVTVAHPLCRSRLLTAIRSRSLHSWRAPFEIDRIDECFGSLRNTQFDRREKIRPFIIRWRNRWKDTPRTADYAVQVLSAVISYAIEELRLLLKAQDTGVRARLRHTRLNGSLRTKKLSLLRIVP
jgi:hypothetical protein